MTHTSGCGTFRPFNFRRSPIKKFAGFALLTGLVFAGVYVGKAPFFGSPFPSERHFQFTYRATLPEIPPEAGKVRIWIPLASTRDGQKVLHREVSASVPYEIHQEPLFGNELLYAETDGAAARELKFEINYEATVDGENFSEAPDSSSPDKFLKSSRLMTVDETVKEKAQAATAGKKSWWEKAKGIYDYVIAHMAYDKTTPGWGQGDTVRACLLGKGNCTDFHSLFISMAHAAEIPSRFKIGFTVPSEGEGKIPGYHCWAEFFDERRGWISVDASEAWKNPRMKRYYFGSFDTNKFMVSLGRDITLVPQQAGEPVNIFIYPYVEMDGQPLNEGIQMDFYFKSLRN